MLAIDSDLLAIFHIFNNDPRFQETRRFFLRLEEQPKAVTVFNLLELCGIVSTATGGEDAVELFHKYASASDVKILFPMPATEDEDGFWASLVSECFLRIKRGMRLGDAAILWTLETNENVSAFITWNTRHFKKNSSIKIMTPAEYLQSAT